MSSSTSSFRKYLLGIFTLIGLGLVVFFAGAETIIKKYVLGADQFYTHRAFFHNSTRPNAVFGDSHAALGLTGLSEFSNLAYPAETYMVLEKKIPYYFRKIQPKKIILQAGPHFMSPNRESLEHSENHLKRLLEPTERFYFYKSHKAHLKNYWIVFLKSLFGGKGFSSVREFQPDGAMTTKGIMSQALTPKQIITMVDKELVHATPYKDFLPLPANKSFLKVLDFFKSQGADVCLVTFPVSPEFVRKAREIKRYEPVLKYFSQIAKQYGYPYKNYFALELPPEFFLNPDHLNHQGAIFFGKKIAQECFN